MTGRRRLRLAWTEYNGRTCLRVGGWTGEEIRQLGGLPAADLNRRLAVLPSKIVEAGAHMRALQPLGGRFEIDDDSVCFVPRFPFLEGTSYSLLVGWPLEESGAERVWTIQCPAKAGAPTTSVVAIYPTADELPVNQLKLYVHFSAPMSEGWSARAIHVRRADNGEPLHGVFLPIGPELWDPERRRLTLLLDPGRIKRGLAPHEEAGYPLIECLPIVVMIDAAFRDAAGRPLRTGAERRYEVAPPVRARVDPTLWRLHCPPAGSMDPLIVEFDRPLDHALLEHSLWVNDAAGMPLAGWGSIGPSERSWRFEPQSPWEEGRYVVTVEPRLEDLAGNSVIRVFDRDLMREEDTPADARHDTIDFTCAAPSAPLPAKLTS